MQVSWKLYEPQPWWATSTFSVKPENFPSFLHPCVLTWTEQRWGRERANRQFLLSTSLREGTVEIWRGYRHVFVGGLVSPQKEMTRVFRVLINDLASVGPSHLQRCGTARLLGFCWPEVVMPLSNKINSKFLPRRCKLLNSHCLSSRRYANILPHTHQAAGQLSKFTRTHTPLHRL